MNKEMVKQNEKNKRKDRKCTAGFKTETSKGSKEQATI